MSSVCARVKTLRKILAEVLSAGDFEWANIQYCKGRVSKKVCPDDVVESPIACTQTTKCAKPLTVITTGLGSPPSWPVEWEVETRIVLSVLTPTPIEIPPAPIPPFPKGGRGISIKKGGDRVLVKTDKKIVLSVPTPIPKVIVGTDKKIVKRDWAKNIKPGGALCLVNSAMEGHCLQFKSAFTPSEKQKLQAHPTEKAATDLLMDLAESICEISLTKQVRQLFPPFVKGVGGFNGKKENAGKSKSFRTVKCG